MEPARTALLEIERDERVATVFLARPNVHNALNRDLIAQLSAACAALDADPEVHVVVIAGRGRSFCSGLDRAEALTPDLQKLVLDGFGDREALYRVRKPTIAAVSGAVFGAGFELALCADFLLADASATFAFPEIGLNGMPGAGGTLRLALHIGPQAAMELCITGRRLGAEEARQLGLISEVIAPDALQAKAQTLARSLAAQPLAPTMLIKQSIRSLQQPALANAMPLQTLSSYACILGRAVPAVG